MCAVCRQNAKCGQVLSVVIYCMLWTVKLRLFFRLTHCIKDQQITFISDNERIRPHIKIVNS